MTNIAEWCDFIAEDEIERIKMLAATRGLGELDYYEWMYVDAQLSYNHAAESTSMDSWIARQLKDAKQEMMISRSEFRSDKVVKFVDWLENDSL